MSRGLADTSVLIAREQGRPIRPGLPDTLAVSFVTIAELTLGVLAAEGPDRAKRLETLVDAQALGPIPVDAAVARAWAELRLVLRESKRRLPVNDAWIAATAIAYGLPVVTQDDDYADLPGVEVIRL